MRTRASVRLGKLLPSGKTRESPGLTAHLGVALLDRCLLKESHGGVLERTTPGNKRQLEVECRPQSARGGGPVIGRRVMLTASQRGAHGPAADDWISDRGRDRHPSFPAALWSPAVAALLSSSGLRHAVGNVGRGKSFAVILARGECGYVLDAGSNLLPLAGHGDEGHAGTHRLRLFAQRRQEWETRRHGRYRRRSAFTHLWPVRRPSGFSPQR